jgi:hypothetical protein
VEQGWIYVLVNSSIPGLAKVGRTTRSPAERVAELSGATGVATPFVLAFDQDFADCVAAEREVHAELDRRGLRVAPNREFFRGSPAEIVRVVLQVAGESDPSLSIKPVTCGAELLAAGDRHLRGTGETLQDLAEAVRCYRLAVRRGSLVALERLGALFARCGTTGSGGTVGRSGRRRAMRFLKEGARRGNYYCYTEMARLYAAEGHGANFVKAWNLFFQQRVTAPCAEAEVSRQRYVHALRHYVADSLILGLQPGHLAELQQEAEPLVRSLEASLDRVRDAPEARQRLAAVLQWAKQNLLPRPIAAARDRGWLFTLPGKLRRAAA